MKTIQVSEATHDALVRRKLDQDARTIDQVIAELLGQRGRRRRLEQEPGLDRLCRAHSVARLRIFGSARTGDDGAESDLDLIVDFEAGARPGLLGLASFGDALEGLLGTRVDVTTEAGLHPALRADVVAEAEVVWHA